MIALKRLLAFWIDYFIILILLAVLVGGKLMWENPILFWSKVAIIIYIFVLMIFYLMGCLLEKKQCKCRLN